jgi:hypothetical protein
VFGGAGLAQGTRLLISSERLPVNGNNYGAKKRLMPSNLALLFHMCGHCRLARGRRQERMRFTLSLTETLLGYSNSPNTTSGIAVTEQLTIGNATTTTGARLAIFILLPSPYLIRSRELALFRR